MGRNIIVTRKNGGQRTENMPLQYPDSAEEPDKYTAQIVKLIPVEIVGVYIGLQNQFSGSLDLSHTIMQVVIFVLILLITPFYLKTVGGITNSTQRLVSILSFVIWGIALGGPFEYILAELGSPFSAKMIGGGLIMLYTLIVPMIYKKAI